VVGQMPHLTVAMVVATVIRTRRLTH
jgi:hypothetical protein